MPPNIQSPYTKTTFTELKVEQRHKDQYKARYNGLDLTPGSVLHEYIKEQVLARAQESSNYMSQYHSKWQELDETLGLYIPTDEAEELRKKKDPRKPVSIVVPESSATLDVFLTYMMSIYSGRQLLNIVGKGPEDTIGAMLLDMLIDIQMKKAKALLNLYIMWRCGFVYSFGPLLVGWQTVRGKERIKQPTGYYTPDGQYIADSAVQQVVDTILFEGAELTPLDPYRYLPDPSVGIDKPQKGSYVGWIDNNDLMQLLADEAQDDSLFINVRYLLNKQNARSSIYMGKKGGRDKNISTDDVMQFSYSDKIDTVYMYWKLIPSMHGLGDSDVPETWLFAVSCDEVVTMAHKVELDHDSYPLVVFAPEFDGFSMMPISKIGLIAGMQKAINFYYNSHMLAIVKALYNTFLINEKAVHKPDLDGDGVPRYIRVRPGAWNSDIKQAIQQLNIHDNTQNHMNDLMITRDLSRNYSGAVDSLQGLQRTRGERVTKAEFMQTSGNALSRLQKIALINNHQVMYDLGRMACHHTQQFMTQPVYTKMIGRYEQDLLTEFGLNASMVQIDPLSISIGFDIDISDSSIDNPQTTEGLIQLMTVGAQFPEIYEKVDFGRLFLRLARRFGERDIFDFMRKEPLILPDETTNKQKQAGNIVPYEEAI